MPKQFSSKEKLWGSILGIILVILAGLFGAEKLLEDNNEYEQLPLEEYYDGADGLSGEELKNFLHDVITEGFTPLSYTNAKTALAETDADPDDASKILTIYSRDSVSGTWDGGDTWAREHVWPNSRLGVERVDESDKNQASDLHNLRPIVPSVNSSRGNKFYDETTDSNSWYPGDEDKGDVARICFYMVVRYPTLTLVDEDLDDEFMYDPSAAKMAKLSMLIRWHHEDPVDDFERHRNEVIYEKQGNRNPFIDHPEFVQYIFEGEEPVADTHSFEVDKVVLLSVFKHTFYDIVNNA